MSFARVDVSPRKSESSRTANLSLSLHDATPEERAQIENLLLTIDADGDGSFSRDEVRQVAVNLLATKRQVRNMKRTMIVGTVAVLAACAAILALVVVGNEATKETHESDGHLEDDNGNSVEVMSNRYLMDMEFFDPSTDLDGLDVMVAKDAAGNILQLKYEGAKRAEATGVYTLFMSRGYNIEMHPGSVEPKVGASLTLVEPDGTRHTYMQSADPLEHLLPSNFVRRRLNARGNGGRGWGHVYTATSRGFARRYNSRTGTAEEDDQGDDSEEEEDASSEEEQQEQGSGSGSGSQEQGSGSGSQQGQVSGSGSQQGDNPFRRRVRCRRGRNGRPVCNRNRRARAQWEESAGEE